MRSHDWWATLTETLLGPAAAPTPVTARPRLESLEDRAVPALVMTQIGTLPPSLNARPTSITVGDLDGDGKAELLATDTNGTITGPVKVAGGRLQVPSSPAASVGENVNAAAGLNYGLAVSLPGKNAVGVLLGNSDGKYFDSPTFSAGFPSPVQKLLGGDLDGNGTSDVVALLEDGSVHVSLRIFRFEPLTIAGTALDVHLIDGDCDGTTDELFVVTPQKSYIIDKLNHSGDPHEFRTVEAGGAFGGVGDFDGDGKDDVAVADPATGKIVTFLNDGTALRAGPSGACPADGVAIAVGDVTGDGVDDLVLARSVDLNGGAPSSSPEFRSSLSVLTVKDAAFSTAATITINGSSLGLGARCLAAGDLDGDGNAEVALMYGGPGGGPHIRGVSPGSGGPHIKVFDVREAVPPVTTRPVTVEIVSAKLTKADAGRVAVTLRVTHLSGGTAASVRVALTVRGRVYTGTTNARGTWTVVVAVATGRTEMSAIVTGVGAGAGPHVKRATATVVVSNIQGRRISATPVIVAFLSRKGYDYYQARSN